MKLGVIGLGFVGLSLASVLGSKGYKVSGFDSDKSKLNAIKNGIPPFYEPELEYTLKAALRKGFDTTHDLAKIINNCELIFITVGTPQQDDGSIDLSMIKSVASQSGSLLRDTKNKPIIIVKSTVVPGTTQNILLPILEKRSRKSANKDFAVVTNPEFLRESMAIADTKNPHVVVLGGTEGKFMDTVKRFYQKLHKNTPIIVTNSQTAEIIKYANNSFLATKISFINQISNMCQSIPGANVEDVAKTIGLDPRIGPLFLNAGPGYGGSCLPKDVKAMINFSNKIGIKPVLLDAVETVNRYQLENLLSTIKKATGKLKGKKITILGTAFKPDTDDIRDSVSIKLIEILLKHQATISVHDPKAIENTRSIFEDRVEYFDSINDALRGSECAVIMTSWKDYTRINNEHIKQMKRKVIVDTRRMLKKSKINARYFPIGIGLSGSF
ncbi:UDP-glucose dehydrogenase family protein [Candidatus Nitrosotenuis cloacae]|uniref:UDP-glucose dehydrogenase family protein n=1 Tax=Candidatus Nitrosotenuis cloacae TaxID=1603555 RepID=UPI00228041FC|nr:UDP-glucose/GDP-mannose dehydrogenase family protein [Candidatus Nitrosotenuis cloacae]